MNLMGTLYDITLRPCLSTVCVYLPTHATGPSILDRGKRDKVSPTE
jgi:hypothetical protein